METSTTALVQLMSAADRMDLFAALIAKMSNEPLSQQVVCWQTVTVIGQP
jgi:hypothetical protein